MCTCVRPVWNRQDHFCMECVMSAEIIIIIIERHCAGSLLWARLSSFPFTRRSRFQVCVLTTSSPSPFRNPRGKGSYGDFEQNYSSYPRVSASAYTSSIFVLSTRDSSLTRLLMNSSTFQGQAPVGNLSFLQTHACMIPCNAG